MQCMRSIGAPLCGGALLRGSQQAPLGISRTRSTYSHAHRPAGPPAARRALWLIHVVAAPPGLRQIYLPDTQGAYPAVVVYFRLACAPCLYQSFLCSELRLFRKPWCKCKHSYRNFHPSSVKTYRNHFLARWKLPCEQNACRHYRIS